jgi:hypothetical protein
MDGHVGICPRSFSLGLPLPGGSVSESFGTNALFNTPMGVCLANNDETAFVVESSRLRQIDMASRRVNWIAGGIGAYDGIGKYTACAQLVSSLC